ncbi:hypothetical protein B0I35DRAFT_48441 [Stachybotrys elegans]|uniref:Uncharacterized protein n=1 Tax=Stachybotrys elegans TaxID=80388 RepID=A0A8K0T5G9_9HYPO|nr:hypothetical protein B0I35DRAFT_48441 [Stachybotrys elegans]
MTSTAMSYRDPIWVAKQLRQEESTVMRSQAITHLGKALRSQSLFQPCWDALGGASGLAELMSDFSLRDIKNICRQLGRTASASNARPARRAALGELCMLLYGDLSELPHKDPRPLRQYYQDIIPACDAQFVEEWETRYAIDWTKQQRRCLFLGHREMYEQKFFATTFSKEVDFRDERRLFQGNPAFIKVILQHMIKTDTITHIPSDFMSVLVMPVLKKLFRRRNPDVGFLDDFLTTLASCMDVHSSQLSRHMKIDSETPIRYTIDRWLRTHKSGAECSAEVKERTEANLRKFLAFVPSTNIASQGTIYSVYFNILDKFRKCDSNYELLRFVLLHIKDFGADINDESPAGLARLRDLVKQHHTWQPIVFFWLDNAKGLELFERLARADPSGTFLDPGHLNSGNRSVTTHSDPGNNSVMMQRQAPGQRSGDVEIVGCMLRNQVKQSPEPPVWLPHIRAIVKERRKKSEESRVAEDRSFWAQSAVNLSVASGDLQLVDETLLWTRRYINEPSVMCDIYDGKPLGTEDLLRLLTAIPKDPNLNPVARITSDIETSHRIILHLTETAKMSSSQPHSNKMKWSFMAETIRRVFCLRTAKSAVESFDSFFKSREVDPAYSGSAAVEVLWKPFLDLLVQAESLLYDCPQARLKSTFSNAYAQFPRFSGHITADLAAFLDKTMKTRLSPEQMKLQIGRRVNWTMRICSSDQPWLAFPFLQQLVLQGDGADSSWHRHILNQSFLSSLPAKMARDLLHLLANAMQEKMREQSANPRETIDKDGKTVLRPPIIKVTTVKMMAQILQNSQLVGASTACDILLGLLVEARHIDIRVALVSSLLSILKEPSYPSQIHSRVLDALEQHVEPVLSQLNERLPVTETGWAAAESGDELPVIGSETPLADLLCNQVCLEEMPDEAKCRIAEMLVRAYGESAIINARWNRLFMAKLGLPLEDRLPAYPAQVHMFSRMFGSLWNYMPDSAISMMREMTLLNLSPTPNIRRVTERVISDRALLESSAGKHWIAQFQNEGEKALSLFGALKATSHLQQTTETLVLKRKDGKDITLQSLQGFIQAIGKHLIQCQFVDLFDRLVSKLCYSRLHGYTNWKSWQMHSAPALQAFLAEIGDVRIAVQATGRRTPRILPDDFRLRCLLLPLPYTKRPEHVASEGEIQAFALELTKLLTWLENNQPYHRDFAKLKEYLKMDASVESTRVALCLCQHEQNLSNGSKKLELTDYLQLELAAMFLELAAHPEVRPCSEVKNLIQQWVESEDKVIQDMGLVLEKKYLS